MKNSGYIFLFISTFLLFTAKSIAQRDNTWQQSSIEKGFLPIRNYSPREYNASPQNWAIVQDKRGVMYFGNNKGKGKGILEYDGVKWRLIGTPNETTFVRYPLIIKERYMWVQEASLDIWRLTPLGN